MSTQAALFGDARLRWLTGKAFADAVKKGEALANVAVLKTYTADSVEPAGVRKYTFIVSTGSADRDGDIVNPEGWLLDNFKAAGGPVLFGHAGGKPPIGKSPDIAVVAKALRATVEFHPEEIDPFGAMIGKMVGFGSLKSCSPGFRPHEYSPLTGKGMHFQKQELLEWSIVPVPSNPEALREAQGKGIDLTPYVAWCEEALSQAKGVGRWVGKADLEAVLKIASGDPVSVTVPASSGSGVPPTPAANASTGAGHAASDPEAPAPAPAPVEGEGEGVAPADDEETEEEPFDQAELVLEPPTPEELAEAERLLTEIPEEEWEFEVAAAGSVPIVKCGLRKGKKGGYQVTSKRGGKGKTIGKHKSRKAAVRQIAAIHAAKAARAGKSFDGPDLHAAVVEAVEAILKQAGFMAECSECGAKKPKGKKCPKCGGMKDKEAGASEEPGGKAAAPATTKADDESKCGVPMAGKGKGKMRARYKPKTKDAVPADVLKMMGLDPGMPMAEPEPRTFSEILGEREAQEAQSKIVWAFIDAVSSILMNADEADVEEMLTESTQDFIAAAQDAKAALAALRSEKSLDAAMHTKAVTYAVEWATPDPTVPPDVAVLTLPEGDVLERETKRLRMLRTGKLPD